MHAHAAAVAVVPFTILINTFGDDMYLRSLQTDNLLEVTPAEGGRQGHY